MLTEIATGVRLSVPLPQVHTAGENRSNAVAATVDTRVSSDTGKQPVSKSRLESRLESTLAAKALLLLSEEEAGKTRLAEHLGHRSISGELHKQVGRLLQQGLIAMTIPDKPQSRLQRYRLTPSGQALLATLRSE